MKCAYGFRGNSIANLYADNYDNVRFLKFYVLSWPIGRLFQRMSVFPSNTNCDIV